MIALLYLVVLAASLSLLWCVFDGVQALFRSLLRRDAPLRRQSLLAITVPCVVACLALLPMWLDPAGRPVAFPFKPVDLPGYVVLLVVCVRLKRKLGATARQAP